MEGRRSEGRGGEVEEYGGREGGDSRGKEKRGEVEIGWRGEGVGT